MAALGILMLARNTFLGTVMADSRNAHCDSYPCSRSRRASEGFRVICDGCNGCFDIASAIEFAGANDPIRLSG